MTWDIHFDDTVATITMNTNPVNAQNNAFFADFHHAFDRLETDAPDSAVVLTGQGRSFSAGLDFDENMARFARRDINEVRAWFTEYRAVNLRLFNYPRPTAAAVNGHAFAGGLITALACDYRIGTSGDARFSLNEVPIGIPMPSTYLELMRFAIGAPATTLLSLSGITIDSTEALRLGVLHEIVEPTQLLAASNAWLNRTPADCIEAYAFTKAALHAPALTAIKDYSDHLDLAEFPGGVTHPTSLAAQRRRYVETRKREPSWPMTTPHTTEN
jgi:enoyl-CoA hydratase